MDRPNDRQCLGFVCLVLSDDGRKWKEFQESTLEKKCL